MTRRVLKLTGIALAVLLLAVILLSGWLLGTQSGSRTLWGAASGAVDGLTAASLEGRLGGALKLRGLRFENEALRVTIGTLELDWSLAGLLRGEVLLDTLHVAEVTYTQLQSAPPVEDDEPFSLPDRLSLPLAIELRDIRLRSFAYRSAPEEEPVLVDAAALSARYRGTDLSIESLSAHGPLFRLNASADAQTRDDFPLTLALDWAASPTDLAPLRGSLAVDGDLRRLRATHSIDAPYNASQRITVSDLLDEDMRLDVRVEIDGTRLRAIRETLPAATVSGTLRAEGRVDNLGYAADLALDGADFGRVALLARGGFRDQVLAIQQLLLDREPGGARLEIAGRVNLSHPVPTVDLQGDWQDLAWPLVGEPRISSGAGRFTLAGTVDDYSVDLETGLVVPDQTGGQLTLSGRGDSESFELAGLQLTLLDGSLNGRGRVRWRPDIRGEIALDGAGLDPAVLAPDFPGDLSIVVRAEGGVSDGVVDADIEALSISGTFREQPVDVEVEGGYQNARLRLESLNARSGESHISASGSVGDSLDLQWAIDSPDLGDLLPGATGSLVGDGRLAGPVALPSVRGSLQGKSVAYGEYRLQRLSLDLDVDLAREEPSTAALALDDAFVGDIEIHRISLSADGNRSDHQLALRVDSAEGIAQLDLSGSLTDAQWRGHLTDGTLQYRELGAWRLADAPSLLLSAEAQSIARGCWRSGDARLCLQGSRKGAAVDAALSLDAFDLDYLRSLVPEAVSVAGRLSAQVAFHQPAGASPALELTADADGVELRTGQSSEQPDQLLLGLESSRILANYGDAGARLALSLPFTTGGGIEATADVGAGSAPLTERPLRGQVSLALADIGFLDALSSEIEGAAGALSGDVDIAGTLAAPVPDGEIRLAGGALELAGPGLNITDIAVRVSSSDGRTLDFDGGATSGGGAVSLGGSARLDGAGSDVDLTIQGDRFEVVNTVDARVSVSPDLEIALRESGIAISGDVEVPRAEITPKELPQSVVTASTDEVIITGDGEEGAVVAAQREITATIRIRLGDAVSLDGFGLKARLAGGLTVSQAPGKPTLGSGEITLLDGEYRAYGQGLVIDSGRILFAGGPISQPGINVRALRRPAEGIVVGVSARGPLENPEFSIFSEPGMTQSEQLSWLVLGRPLDGASEGEGNMIAQAALALGLKGGDMLAGRLGEELGVDSVGIETGSGEAGGASDVNQAAFVIGKYLSPDLFVSYGIGLFDSISTVRLEYSLTEHWKVSTESSTLASGGDVTYTIERR